VEDEEGRKGLHNGRQDDQEHKLTLPTVSNYTIHETTNDSDNGKQEGRRPTGLSIYCGFATSSCVSLVSRSPD